MEIVNSKIKYEKGTIVEDDVTKEIFEVVSCIKHGISFKVTLKKHVKNSTTKIFEELRECLGTVKIHDKDLFMLENIVDTLEDSLK